MGSSRFGRALSVAALFAVAALACAIWRRAGPGPVQAAADGQPLLLVQDERDAGARSAEPAVYVVWPGKKKVEVYSSRLASFVTYDFVARSVTFHEAKIR